MGKAHNDVIPPINPDNPPKTNCNFTSLTLIFSNFIDSEFVITNKRTIEPKMALTN